MMDNSIKPKVTAMRVARCGHDDGPVNSVVVDREETAAAAEPRESADIRRGASTGFGEVPLERDVRRALQVSAGPASARPSGGWDEAAIRRFTSRGIPIRDFRARASRPEWQVDTRALRSWLEADLATASSPAQSFSIDYSGCGVPQAQCALKGPGQAGAYGARLTTADGRVVQLLSDGPLTRVHLSNLARTVGESNPQMFCSRYPGQGETTVIVTDHLGQFTTSSGLTDVAGLGGQGPAISLDRLLLESQHIGSLTHEWLHTFDHAASVVSRQARGGDGKPLFGPEGSARPEDFVSTYSRSNPLEDFAETGEWVNDVLNRAHAGGVDLARTGAEGFVDWTTSHWNVARPEGGRQPSARLLEKAAFIYRSLNLAPDVPVTFCRSEGTGEGALDPDRVMQFRREAGTLAAANPHIQAVEIEVGLDGRTYRATLADGAGGSSIASLRVPMDAQVDLTTTAALLDYCDVRMVASQTVFVPTAELNGRDGSAVRGGKAALVGPDVYLDEGGSPQARLEGSLRHGRAYGHSEDLVINIGPEDMTSVLEPLSALMSGPFHDLAHVTVVDCEGNLVAFHRLGNGGVERQKGVALGELPARVRAEQADRAAAARARAEALAPKRAPAADVASALKRVELLATRARAGSDNAEMLGMMRDMLQAPGLTQPELESIIGEVSAMAREGA